MIDFESEESFLLLNPRLPPADRARLERSVPSISGHVFVATSGSTGAIKLVALSKRAVLASAAAVNERLGAGKGDVWGAVLPAFHVGGLGIYARAHLSGARVSAMPWNPAELVATCDREGITLLSVVPSQVHDLVQSRSRAPRSLRAVLVGGAAFDAGLSAAARNLGWPVLGSYGCSECCSTVAVEAAAGGPMIVLRHLEAKAGEGGRLAFRGASLLTGYAGEGGSLLDPKVDGWFVTEDLGAVRGRELIVRGRGADHVKIGGEAVDLTRLDGILETIAGDTAAVVAVPDERLGHVIHLAVTGDGERIRDAFDALVLPFERVRKVHLVAQLPRSPLGKLQRAELAKQLARRARNGPQEPA